MTTPRTPSPTTKRTSRSATPASKAPRPSEKQFQAAVVELAERAGWLVFHVGDARKIVHRQGRPVVVPDPEAGGFPDLVLVHPKRRRVVYAELKKHDGRVRPKQKVWLEALAAAGQETFLWRPEHMDIIEKELTRR